MYVYLLLDGISVSPVAAFDSIQTAREHCDPDGKYQWGFEDCDYASDPTNPPTYDGHRSIVMTWTHDDGRNMILMRFRVIKY